MPDNHIAVSQEVDQYASQRIAATAAAKAERLWPGIIGEVLADEIMALLDLPSWMRSQTRTHQLIDAIQDIAEESAASSNERPAA
jgi:TusA-related sulfurtransferase